MNLAEKVLNNVSLDPRIEDGIFSIEDNAHMDVLREYFVNHGIDEELARDYCNTVLEGKYPERQAYNQKGILVTFPTPEYKQKAIQRGTHFEKDPTKGQSNLFGGGQQAPQPGQQAPQAPVAPEPKPGEGAPKTSLPLSQAGGAPPPQSDTPKPDQPAPVPTTTAAPQQTQTPTTPVVEPEEPAPAPPPKSDAEKEADKQVIKTMLKGDDYMLERFSAFIAEHKNQLDGDLLEHINYRIRK